MDKTTETTAQPTDTTAIAVQAVDNLKSLMLELTTLGVKFTASVTVSVSIDGEEYVSEGIENVD